MMKTDELVKRLREYTEWARANEWEVPITLADALEAAADTIEHLDNEAADKIEVQAGLLKYGSNKIHDLEHELDAMKRSGWIGVDDRLDWLDPEIEVPSDDGAVLGIVNGVINGIEHQNAVSLVCYGRGEWWMFDRPDIDVKVDWWMPLPEMPKEDEA